MAEFMKEKKKRKLSWIWIVVGIIALVVIGMMLKKSDKGMGWGENDDSAVTVIVTAATNGSVSKYLNLTGALAAENEVSVYPDVAGKVAWLSKYEGDYVYKGTAIAYIDRFMVGQTYEYSPVLAPVSGYITSLDLEVGETVSAAVPVGTIGNLKSIEVEVNIPEIFVSDVEIGQTVDLTLPAFDDEVFVGEITRKELKIDSLSRTLLVRVTVDNSDLRLYSGMYADADVLVATAEDKIVLPAGTTFEQDDLTYVYINNENVAELREVDVLFTYKDYTAIDSGIEEGEEVVIFGREYLEDGTVINPIYEDDENDDETNEIVTEEVEVESSDSAGSSEIETLSE